MPTIKTLSKGQVVIPAEMRKKYHIENGPELQVMKYDGIIHLLLPMKNLSRRLAEFWSQNLYFRKGFLKKRRV